MSNSNSVEVSVPTDLTVTSEGDSEDGYITAASSRRHARELQALAAEKALFQKQVEKLKLELQNKNAQMNAMGTHHEKVMNQLILQKDNIFSEKQVQANRLEGEISRYKDDLKTIKQRAARELAQLAKKCHVFQQNQKRLTIKQEELRSSLNNLTLSRQEYEQLKCISCENLSLQQFTSMRVYEMVWPLHLKNNELETIKSSLESITATKDSQLKSKEEECRIQKLNIDNMREKINSLSEECNLLREDKSTDNFKVRNYDRIKRERDQFEIELKDLRKYVNETDLQLNTEKKEKQVLSEKYTELNLKFRKQEQDLSHCKYELSEMTAKLQDNDAKLKYSKQEIDQEHDKGKQFHDKYLNSVEQNTLKDMKLKDSLQELKILKEKLNECTHNKLSIKHKLDEMTKQFETASFEAEQFKSKYRIGRDAYEEEISKLKVSLSCVSKSRDNLVDENTKLLKELHQCQSLLIKERICMEKESFTVNQQLQRALELLSQYEALEEEYNDSIRTVAALPEQQAKSAINKIIPWLSTPGYKTLEQTVSLTRRVLQLERENTEACKTIQQLTDGLDKLRSAVSSYKSALGQVSKPTQRILLEVVEKKDQIDSLQDALKSNVSKNDKLVEENNKLREDITKYQQSCIQFNLQIREIEDIKRNLINLLQNTNNTDS